MQTLNLMRLIIWMTLVVGLRAGNYSSSLTRNSFSFIHERPKSIEHLLQRKKRWLIYEPGSSVVLTMNWAKAILGTIPRGLVLLCETSSIYPLPAAVADFRSRRLPKTTSPLPTTSSTTTPPPAPITAPSMRLAAIPPAYLPLSSYDPVHQFYYDYPYEYGFNRRQSGCPAANLILDQDGNYYCHPAVSQVQYQRRLARHLDNDGATNVEEKSSLHTMLFDLLILYSKIYNYNPRHCIMRTLCESRHILLPPGEHLFHDVVRILLKFVFPEIAQNPQYQKAFTRRHSLKECSVLYGVHCRHSPLLRLTQMFWGEFSNNKSSSKS